MSRINEIKQEIKNSRLRDLTVDDVSEILTDYKQTSFRNAVLADAVDVVPVLGDVTNFIRLHRIRQDTGAFKKGQERRQKRLELLLDAKTPRNAIKIIKKSVDEAIEEANELRKKRAGMQAVDAVAGIIPGVGFIGDLVTPTNTINYWLSKGEK